MERMLSSFLAGAGLGVGLMFALDPQMGRRRRALARDKMVSLGHQAQQAAEVVGRDMGNRARGLASGDLSVLVGGKRALRHPFKGGWSPTGRALMTGLGAGLFLFGLTRDAPAACILGSIGFALAAEGITNLGVSDVKCAAQRVASAVQSMSESGSAAQKSPSAEPALSGSW